MSFYTAKIMRAARADYEKPCIFRAQDCDFTRAAFIVSFGRGGARCGKNGKIRGDFTEKSAPFV